MTLENIFVQRVINQKKKMSSTERKKKKVPTKVE